MGTIDSTNLTIHPDVIDFLRESNNIENEWNDLFLQQAIFAWNYAMSEDELTPSVVLKVHKILMLHAKIRPDQRGYFRQEPVYIGGHEAKPWFVLRELVQNWCDNQKVFITDENKQKVKENLGAHVWAAIQQSHIDYEAIHPFIDGNGRTGRIFMNWQRVKMGFPIFVVREKEKMEYYHWFDERK